MPPKKIIGHVKCAAIPEGTIYKGTNKREIIVGREFAQGGFGRICEAKLVGKSDKYIIKLEPSGNGPLFTEMHVFQRILRQEMLEAYKKKQKLPHLGLPYLVESGMQEDIRFLVMPKYSYCLDHIITESRSPLKLENIVDIVICVANALKYMHDNDYVHADVKAANIMMNKKNSFNEVYLIDFGLARKVGTVVEKEDKKKAHDGTAYFTSTDAHRGCGFTFRGDAEILAHNALYWLSKTLPWMDIFDEDATIKAKAEQLVKIQAAKEKLLSNLPAIIKKLVSDSTAAAMVQMLYNASKIDINTKPDFDKLVKSLPKASSERKKHTQSESEDQVEPAPKPSARRARKPTTLEESAEEEVDPTPKPAAKRGRQRESDDDVRIEPTPKPSARRGRKPTFIEESEEEEPKVAPKSSTSRARKPIQKSESDEEIIPQPSVRRAPKRIPFEESTEEELKPTPKPSTHRTRKPVMMEESDEKEMEPAPKPSARRAPKHALLKESNSSKLTPAKPLLRPDDVTPSPRRYPVDDRSPIRVKKPLLSYELIVEKHAAQSPAQFKNGAVVEKHAAQSPAQPRTRSIDQHLFSPRYPSPTNQQQYYDPKASLRRRSRTAENTPPESPEFRIRPVPQPTGCSVM